MRLLRWFHIFYPEICRSRANEKDTHNRGNQSTYSDSAAGLEAMVKQFCIFVRTAMPF